MKVDSECVGSPETIIKLNLFEDDNHDGIWIDSNSSFVASGEFYTWEMTAMGGNSREFDEKDMYAHDDRGVYFNGFNKFMTIEDIMLSSTFTISTWVKPQSVGTIMAISNS